MSSVGFTETTKPVPDLLVRVYFTEHRYATGWHWSVVTEGKTVESGARSACRTRWGAERRAKRAARRIVRQRTRTYTAWVASDD